MLESANAGTGRLDWPALDRTLKVGRGACLGCKSKIVAVVISISRQAPHIRDCGCSRADNASAGYDPPGRRPRVPTQLP